MKKVVLFGVFCLIMVGCKQNTSSQADGDATTNQEQTANNTEQENENKSISVSGDYADEGYEKRSEGYDWVAVRITELADNQIGIKFRSRSDIKAPSCSFDGVAKKVSEGVYQIQMEDDAVATFTFKDNTLSVTESKRYTLNYYCSGGGTLVGDYTKVSQPITELN